MQVHWTTLDVFELTQNFLTFTHEKNQKLIYLKEVNIFLSDYRIRKLFSFLCRKPICIAKIYAIVCHLKGTHFSGR